MTISPKCDLCPSDLEDFGGIILSPPDKETQLVRKYHVCLECYKEKVVPLFNADDIRVEQIIEHTTS